MLLKAPPAIIIGFGQSGQEHYRVANLFKTFNVIKVIDLDDRNLEVYDIQLETPNTRLKSGYVIDSRPFLARKHFSVEAIAEKYFEIYTVLEEKPESGHNEALVNYQRSQHPFLDWLSKKMLSEKVKNIMIIETVATPQLDELIVSDLLPHTISLIQKLMPTDKCLILRHDLKHQITSVNGLSKILWTTGSITSTIIALETNRRTFTITYPTLQTSISRSIRVLNLNTLLSIYDNFIMNSARLYFFLRHDLLIFRQYDWFKFSHKNLRLQRRRSIGEYHIEFHNAVVPPVEKKRECYDFTIFGGSGKLGTYLREQLLKINSKFRILVVSRRRIEISDCDCCDYSEFFSFNFSNLGKVVYLSSPMTQGISRHHAHNDQLLNVLKKLKNTQFEEFLFLSTVAVQIRPNDCLSPLHTLESSIKRSPYAYGKLLDLRLIQESSIENFVEIRAGIIEYEDEPPYGLHFKLFGAMFIFASRDSLIPTTYACAILKIVMDSNNNIDLVNYTKFDIRYPKAYFVPARIAKVVFGALSPIYRRIYPLENLYLKISHFYHGETKKKYK